MTYPFIVYQAKVENHIFWVAEIPLLKGCVGQGDTAEEAVRELEINEVAWLDTAKEYGIAIPDIPLNPIDSYNMVMAH